MPVPEARVHEAHRHLPRFARIGRGRLALLVAMAMGIVAALMPLASDRTQACAFDPRTPYAYEADQLRTNYRLAFDAVSTNALFASDPFFSLPPIERGTRGARTDAAPFIPADLMKAISWVESDMTMAQRSVRFDSMGLALVSFDCGHGLTQVTTGMTIPLGADGLPSDRQVLIATHYAYNVARGAQILAEKWNAAPEQRPVVGTDTNSDPALIENWYYAVWGYNGFTGPGANPSNHPLDPSLPWPRPAFQCDGSQSRERYPYQELVWGCLARPVQRNNTPLWTAIPATLPDQTNPTVFSAMGLANWSFPYSSMDIPTPQPAHVATAVALPGSYRDTLLGAPVLQSSTQTVSIYLNDPTRSGRATVDIRNAGTGVLSWIAEPSANFLVLTPPGGVALGSGIPCTSGTCPHGVLTIEVNPTLLPSSAANARITVRSPNGGSGTVTINVNVIAEFELGAPGTSLAR
ncbi:MAG: hypothetical protein DWG80_03265 [Chloroflexi bacterium]|nr:hypothetical protein [Chloroflexota bacterium]